MNLIFTKNYFDRWREIYAAKKTGIEAWRMVELELYEQTGLTRYCDYSSFLKGKSKERQLIKSKRIVLSTNLPQDISI